MSGTVLSAFYSSLPQASSRDLPLGWYWDMGLGTEWPPTVMLSLVLQVASFGLLCVTLKEIDCKKKEGKTCITPLIKLWPLDIQDI